MVRAIYRRRDVRSQRSSVSEKKKTMRHPPAKDKVFFLDARIASGYTGSSIIVFLVDENRRNFDVADSTER